MKTTLTMFFILIVILVLAYYLIVLKNHTEHPELSDDAPPSAHHATEM